MKKYKSRGEATKSRRFKKIQKILPQRIANIECDLSDGSNDLQGQGIETTIHPNIIDFWTGLEVLLGLELSGHFDILTEAWNLIDELFRRGEIQNKQQYQNALKKFCETWVYTDF